MTPVLHPIQTESDYRAALAQVGQMVDAPTEPDPDSAQGAYLDALVTLIAAWEAKHYPITPPDPVAAIKFHMEQNGLGVADMQPYIGPKNRVYEVLKGKRRLSLAMVKRLHEGLRIPYESLMAGAA